MKLETNVNRYAEGSCLVSFGHTRVLVTASLDETVPGFLRGRGQGWVTAEYGMLPRATHTRGRREAAEGKQSRPQPGDPAPDRPLLARRDRHEGARRAADHPRLRRHPGRRRHAHGGDHRRPGWRCALATRWLKDEGVIKADPIRDHVAAISCGVVEATSRCSTSTTRRTSSAEADANFVLTGAGDIVEIQATGEKRGFTRAEFETLFSLAQAGIVELVELQKAAVA